MTKEEMIADLRAKLETATTEEEKEQIRKEIANLEAPQS